MTFNQPADELEARVDVWSASRDGVRVCLGDRGLIRFIIVGGFLGAGKTTTIARLAKGYQEQGLNVAIVTNDQGSDLVDTYRLLAEGYNVGEISGACFCGNVDTLVATIDQLGMTVRPQVVLVEPIGSCVDLAATVIRPLAFQFSKEFSIAPYGVILKPRNALRILQNQPNAGVSPKAIYIFRQQLEEADFLVINRVDELSASEIDLLSKLLDEQYPGRPVIRMSAKTGSGFTDLERTLDQSGDFGRRVLKLDYDQYVAGEAALGWLNGTVMVKGKTPFSLDAFVLDLVRRAQRSLVGLGAEIAHLKAIGSHAGIVSAANLVDNELAAELSIEAGENVPLAQVTVNARVGVDPAVLDKCVREAISETCAARQLDVQILLMQSFRPGGPVPA
jgi:Ni2+-binding GTPase involved in maturation of urease and hydrogenase